LAKTREPQIPTAYLNMRNGRLSPTANWYNCHYWLLNGLLVHSKAWNLLNELIAAGIYTDLGDAIRAGIQSLIEKHEGILVKFKGACEGDTLERTIVQLRKDADMVPDETGVEHLKHLATFYKTVGNEP
jgi:Arc/MetJ-type ribon-helix-helix transcriptional regulator